MPVHACMKAEFREEAMGNVNDENLKKDIRNSLDTIFLEGVQVYKGYADDPRNTDNAWIETSAFNYHDENGSILKYFTLRVCYKNNASLTFRFSITICAIQCIQNNSCICII